MYQRILACIDFSESAPKVLIKARELARQNQAELVLMHVVEYVPPMELAGDPLILPSWGVDEQDLLQRAQQSLRTLAEQQGCAQCRQITVIGIPKLEIRHVLEESRIDLLVIGAHSRHGLGRLLGSTAHGLLNHASCDVLAVHLE